MESEAGFFRGSDDFLSADNNSNFKTSMVRHGDDRRGVHAGIQYRIRRIHVSEEKWWYPRDGTLSNQPHIHLT